MRKLFSSYSSVPYDRADLSSLLELPTKVIEPPVPFRSHTGLSLDLVLGSRSGLVPGRFVFPVHGERYIRTVLDEIGVRKECIAYVGKERTPTGAVYVVEYIVPETHLTRAP